MKIVEAQKKLGIFIKIMWFFTYCWFDRNIRWHEGMNDTKVNVGTNE